MNKDLPSKNFLRNFVSEALHEYFSKLEGEPTSGIYALVLSEIEIPLLEVVMHYAKGNESRAALWLGVNRGTLRKLLAKYNL